jgi:hypothetical protein
VEQGDAAGLAGAQRREMSGWSPEEAIAMERLHILEGEKRVARQEALMGELIGDGYAQLALTTNDVLNLMRETLELSRRRLRSLEGLPGEPPKSSSDAPRRN